MSTLSSKQQVFISEYLKCWNSSEAARRAGYTGKSNVVGPRLLANVSIKAEIDARVSEIKMSADEVLTRLADHARGDISDLIKPIPMGNKSEYVVDIGKAIANGKTHLIKKLGYNKFGGLEIELYDAQAALVHIGRAHGLFTDKIDLKLEKEIDSILELLEGVLDADSYQRVLQALTDNHEGGTETPEANK